MTGIYSAKRGDRVYLIRRPGYFGTVIAVQVEDKLHSGKVTVQWDGSSSTSDYHVRSLEAKSR